MRALAALVLVPLLAGCLSCEPLLEVRNCFDRQCTPSDDAVELDWNATLAEEWPALEEAMAGTPPGEHHHEGAKTDWEHRLWAAFGVTGDEKELIVHRDGERFRVRVLSCD